MSIIYTPLPIEMVLEGMDKVNPQYQEIEYGGVKLLVEPLGMERYKVVRLISTDPMDYLKNEFQPGSELKFKPQANCEEI